MYSTPTGTTATRRPLTATETEWGLGEKPEGTNTHRVTQHGGKEDFYLRLFLDDGKPDKEGDEIREFLYGERVLSTQTSNRMEEKCSMGLEGDKDEGKGDTTQVTTVTRRPITATVTETEIGTDITRRRRTSGD